MVKKKKQQAAIKSLIHYLDEISCMYFERIDILWDASNASNKCCLLFHDNGIRPAKWYATESAELKSTLICISATLGCFMICERIF